MVDLAKDVSNEKLHISAMMIKATRLLDLIAVPSLSQHRLCLKQPRLKKTHLPILPPPQCQPHHQNLRQLPQLHKRNQILCPSPQ